MTIEHVSVPRELLWIAVNAFQQCGMEGKANELQAILSRATPSDELQGAFAECYTSEKGLAMLQDPECGISTVVRVKTNYSCIPLFLQPQTSAPRMVTAKDVDRCLLKARIVDSYDSYITENAMRAALESFATSLPAARVPDGFVLVTREYVESVNKAAAIASAFSPCIDSVEENGGEEHEDPSCAIHYLLYYAGNPLAAAPTPETKG